MQFTTAEISAWLGSFLWPFFRIGSMLMVAPITGAQYVPMRARLALALALTVAIMPLLDKAAPLTAFSWPFFVMIIQQILIGTAMGFALLLVFNAIVTGGQLIAMQMGLGFASMVDPQNGMNVPVLAQLYMMMTTLLFLVMDGHLVLISLSVESFYHLPLDGSGIDSAGFRALADWGARMLAGGVWMALPAVASLLVVNIAFGVMARAAPQLNIFAVGFPVSMMMGFLVILYTLPTIVPQFTAMLDEGFNLIRSVIGGE